LSLGSDSHAVIDMFEEARAMELNERLRSRVRGHWTAAQLLRAASEDGHASLGWPEAGRLEAGALADFTRSRWTRCEPRGHRPDWPPRPRYSRRPERTSGTPWWPAGRSSATDSTS